MITLENYLTSNSKYKDRLQSPDLTEQVKTNATMLLKQVNALLSELGYTTPIISSGFRTAASNASTPNSAKKSLHMSGLAIDIQDNGPLKTLITNNISLLKKYNLWMEAPESTPSWCHLDLGNRTPRDKNVFRP